MEDLVERFCSVTGSDANVASHFLQMTNGDIDNAITFYFDSDPSGHSQVVDTNNSMSQNMQPMDESRQPIPQKHERLIELDVSAGITVHRRSPMARNVFNVDPQSNLFIASGSAVATNQNGSGSTLDKMFEPPTNLLFNGTFEEAKQHARNNNSWLLVSIHNNDIFDCHRLNRDLWKNRNIINLVKESFVLWQVLNNRFEAHNFVQWYPYDKDSAHLAVIDPVTGESKMSFFGPEITEPNEMYKTLSSFIKYNSPAVSATNSRKRPMATSEDSDPECMIDLTESIPRIKKMKILSPLSDNDDDISGDRRRVRCERDSPENWLDYLGREEDPIYTILIRLPSGSREMLSIPSSSQLKALFLYIRDRGCELHKYDLVKCFPKQILTPKMGSLTLASCGIVNKDTLHVQETG